MAAAKPITCSLTHLLNFNTQFVVHPLQVREYQNVAFQEILLKIAF